jgi:hypothetical protein
LGPVLLPDALYVRERKEAPQSVVGVNNEELVGSHILGEEAVCPLDWIGAKVADMNGGGLRPGGHDFKDPLLGVALADDLSGQQT